MGTMMWEARGFHLDCSIDFKLCQSLEPQKPVLPASDPTAVTCVVTAHTAAPDPAPAPSRPVSPPAALSPCPLAPCDQAERSPLEPPGPGPRPPPPAAGLSAAQAMAGF